MDSRVASSVAYVLCLSMFAQCSGIPNGPPYELIIFVVDPYKIAYLSDILHVPYTSGNMNIC